MLGILERIVDLGLCEGADMADVALCGQGRSYHGPEACWSNVGKKHLCRSPLSRRGRQAGDTVITARMLPSRPPSELPL